MIIKSIIQFFLNFWSSFFLVLSKFFEKKNKQKKRKMEEQKFPFPEPIIPSQMHLLGKEVFFKLPIVSRKDQCIYTKDYLQRILWVCIPNDLFKNNLAKTIACKKFSSIFFDKSQSFLEKKQINDLLHRFFIF